ncbi:hypothetical protein DPMN_079487, partial [Dreissena polymorpha]
MISICLTILPWIIWSSLTGAQEVTLSGNGTSSNGSAVTEGSALTLNCSTSQDALNIVWWKKKSYESVFTRLFEMDRLSSGTCEFASPIPAGMTCACISARLYVCTIGRIQDGDHGDSYRCDAFNGFSGFRGSSNTLQINILVRVSSVTLTPDLFNLTVIDGINTQILCKTSIGRPAPTVNWYKVSSAPGAPPVEITSQISSISNETGTSSTLNFTPSRGDDGWKIYCTATNLGPPISSQSQPSLNVAYGPGKPVFTYRGQTVTGPIRISQGTSLVMSCISDSKPGPLYMWTYPGGSYTGQTLTLSNINTTHGGIFAVTAWYTISPTGDTSVNKTNASQILVDILYQPTVPTFRIGNSTVSGKVKIINGNSKTISCSSQSNPAPIYTWTPGGTTNNADLVLSNLQHPSGNKQYICTVENTMQSTGDTYVVGQANATVAVEVL